MYRRYYRIHKEPVTGLEFCHRAETLMWWERDGEIQEHRILRAYPAFAHVGQLLDYAEELNICKDAFVAVFEGLEKNALEAEGVQDKTRLLLSTNFLPILEEGEAWVEPKQLIRWETVDSVSKYIRMTVDEENNAEEFWDAMRETCEAYRGGILTPRSVPECLRYWVAHHVEWGNDIWLSPNEAAEALMWLSTIPGWADGPEYARYPLLFHEQ